MGTLFSVVHPQQAQAQIPAYYDTWQQIIKLKRNRVSSKSQPSLLWKLNEDWKCLV